MEMRREESYFKTVPWKLQGDERLDGLGLWEFRVERKIEEPGFLGLP